MVNTKALESATRKKIDLQLQNLSWKTDESESNCTVFTERAKTTEQNKKLKGKKPDYILYESNTDRPIAVIETKMSGQSIDKALAQAVDLYAIPLGIKIAIATDGTLYKCIDVGTGKELTIDDQPLTEIVSERILLRFIYEGSNISEATQKVKYTREELINIFKWTNDLLRKEGLREGSERFAEFANILFLKLISEIEEDRSRNSEKRLLDEKYCWDSFKDLDPDRMLEYINGIILPKLIKEYNHSGDVFQDKLQIRSPQTLKLIVDKLSKLKLINTDSDIKGDAFEYFLKKSVTVGNDLGEYFTPRHIVRLMVKLVNPQFGDKIYDPACGTGGFLIEAFSVLKRTCKQSSENILFLKNNSIYGREITNTAKIAKMNMIIAGDGHTNIIQIDSLKKPVTKAYDIVLANMPYGQTTDWGTLYPFPSNQADSIFIQHILLSLKEGGRAAIIVPEGSLFRGGVDKKVREFMLKNYTVEAVISLPSGVFLPYTSAKTNILVIKASKPKMNKVWFYNLQNDGYELSMTRKPNERNDIGDLLFRWSDEDNKESEKSWYVSLNDISKNNYDLSTSRYKKGKGVDTFEKYSLVKFSEIMSENKDKLKIEDLWTYRRVTVKLHGQGLEERDVVYGSKIKTKEQKMIKSDQFIVAEIDAKLGGYGVVPVSLNGSIVSSHYFLFDLDKSKVHPSYFDYVVRYGPYQERIKPFVKGTTNYASVRPSNILSLDVPLPSIEIQEQFAKELDILSDKKNKLSQCIDVLKEGFVSESDFQTTKGKKETLGKLFKVISGGTPRRDNSGYFVGNIPWVKISDFQFGKHITSSEEKITDKAMKESSTKLLPKGTVLVSIFATIGSISILDIDACTNQAIAGLLPNKDVNSEYLAYYLMTKKPYFESLSRGIAQKNINLEILRNTEMSIPDLTTQNEIVEKLDKRKEAIFQLIELKEKLDSDIRNKVNNLFGI